MVLDTFETKSENVQPQNSGAITLRAKLYMYSFNLNKRNFFKITISNGIRAHPDCRKKRKKIDLGYARNTFRATRRLFKLRVMTDNWLSMIQYNSQSILPDYRYSTRRQQR